MAELSLAPWEFTLEDTNDEIDTHVVVTDKNGNMLFDTTYSDVVEIHEERDEFAYYWDEQGRVNFEFICLVRNAYDVMMRRGWYVIPVPVYYNDKNKILWRVTNVEGGVYRDELRNMPMIRDCPFKALVEADQWYVENIEVKDIK